MAGSFVPRSPLPILRSSALGTPPATWCRLGLGVSRPRRYPGRRRHQKRGGRAIVPGAAPSTAGWPPQQPRFSAGPTGVRLIVESRAGRCGEPSLAVPLRAFQSRAPRQAKTQGSLTAHWRGCCAKTERQPNKETADRGRDCLQSVNTNKPMVPSVQSCEGRSVSMTISCHQAE